MNATQITDIFVLRNEIADEAAADAVAEAQRKEEQEATAQAEREARWKKQRENERLALLARDLPHLTVIAAELKKLLKPEDKFSFEAGEIKLNGRTLSNFSIDEERAHLSAWRSKPSGKLRISTGDYGEKTSFPQRKDGTFAYDKIAFNIHCEAMRNEVQGRAEATRRKNSAEAEALRKRLGIESEWGAVQASSVKELPIRVNIKIDRSMTAESAENLIKTLNALGIKFF